jgi:glycosyltransferase involved in cell wall biosynthesis
LSSVDHIAAKSSILPLGLDLEPFDIYNPAALMPLKKNEPSSKAAGSANDRQTPLILWNHRWEYDKNPEAFFQALVILAGRGLDFEVAVLGKNFGQQPEAFKQARQVLGERVIQFGYVEDFAAYAAWLWRANLLPVTSNQEFFGASLMQALYCNCYPLLPKRLVYPELIPTDRQADYFYDDLEDLVERLALAIQNIDSIRQQRLRPVAAQYGWGLMAPHYDQAFKKIVATATLS